MQTRNGSARVMLFAALSCCSATAGITQARSDSTPAEHTAIGVPTSRGILIEYDAGLGTLPTGQGWALSGTLDSNDEVLDSVFFLNSSGPTVAFSSSSIGFDWNVGLRYSMTARVPVGTVAVTFLGPGYRGGASLYARDSFGRSYSVLVGANSFVFSSQSNLNPDPVLTVQMPFDAATDFHTYSIVSNEDGATLHIDGVPRASVPAGDINLPGSPVVSWSIDPRAFAVESEWKSVVLGADVPCTADQNGDGLVNFFDIAVFLGAFNAGCP